MKKFVQNMKKRQVIVLEETIQEVTLPEMPVSMLPHNSHTDTAKSNLSHLSLQEQHLAT